LRFGRVFRIASPQSGNGFHGSNCHDGPGAVSGKRGLCSLAAAALLCRSIWPQAEFRAIPAPEAIQRHRPGSTTSWPRPEPGPGPHRCRQPEPRLDDALCHDLLLRGRFRAMPCDLRNFRSFSQVKTIPRMCLQLRLKVDKLRKIRGISAFQPSPLGLLLSGFMQVRVLPGVVLSTARNRSQPLANPLPGRDLRRRAGWPLRQ
jgi:hypothetical protein